MYHCHLPVWILKNSCGLRHFSLFSQDRRGTDCRLGNFYLFLSVRSNLSVEQNVREVAKEMYAQGCCHNKDFRSRIIFSPSSPRCGQSTFSGSSHGKQLKDEKSTSCVDRPRVPCQNSRPGADGGLAFSTLVFMGLRVSVLTAV